jgi:hypothetical protein
MSEEEKLITEYLKEIELKLPFWLKNDPEELKNVLEEHKQHIEEKVAALEESGLPKGEAIRKTIYEMGSPSQIAREYKRRGTPKFFISEEIWPTYLNVLRYAEYIVGAIFAIVITVNALVTGLTGGDWLGGILAGLASLITWSIMVAAGISVLFVWFSYEGIMPEDLRKLFKSKANLVSESKQPPKTTIIPSAKTPSAPPQIVVTKKPYPKRLDKPHDLIIGGVMAIVLGVVAVLQPFPTIMALIDPKFLDILMAAGIFWVIIGIFAIIHGASVSWSYQANRALYPARAIISMVAGITIITLLLLSPEIFPIPIWTEETGFQILSIAPEFYWIYFLICSLILVAIIGTAIYNIVKGAILDEAYFLAA